MSSSSATALTPRARDLLSRARVVWIGASRPDGRPHLVPAWFVWDGTEVVVLSRPGAAKVSLVRRDGRVMLGLMDGDLFDGELIEGEGRVVEAATDDLRERIADKYGDAIGRHGFTPSSFMSTFATAIRIRPNRALDWGRREQAQRGARLALAPV